MVHDNINDRRLLLLYKAKGRVMFDREAYAHTKMERQYAVHVPSLMNVEDVEETCSELLVHGAAFVDALHENERHACFSGIANGTPRYPL